MVPFIAGDMKYSDIPANEQKFIDISTGPEEIYVLKMVPFNVGMIIFIEQVISVITSFNQSFWRNMSYVYFN